MAVTIEERKKGTRTLSSKDAKREYIIRGVADENAALSTLLTANAAVVPANVNGFPTSKVDWGVEEIGDGSYIGTAVWKANEFTPTQQQAPNTFRYSFDISGQNQRVFFSKETTGKRGKAGSTAPDFKNAIGVTPERTVEGCDILIPFMTWTATFTTNAAQVTAGYVSGLYNCVGTTNTAAWGGFEADVLLLTGVSGDKRYYIDDQTPANNGYVYDLSFKFAVSKNASNITIGDIQPFSKKGWEYLWVYYEDKPVGTGEDKTIVRVPKYAYCERVYDKSNYATYLGF